MKIRQKTRTGQVLIIMRVLAWVAFFGLAIKAGAILTAYIVSCVNPAAATDLYQGLNLYDVSQFSFWHYTGFVSFLVAFSGMKAFVCFLVVKTLSKVNLAKPFTLGVTRILERISYVLLSTWIIALLHNGHIDWLMKRTGTFHDHLNPGELIFMAGLVFIISQVFKRGVEMQSENDLTV